MPKKLQTAIQVPSNIAPTFDQVEITAINIVNHIQKEGETGFSGNIEVGDTLAVDEADSHISEKKFAVHYVMTENNIIVYKGSLMVEGDDLSALLAGSPSLYNDIKTSAYKALTNESIIPENAILT